MKATKLFNLCDWFFAKFTPKSSQVYWNFDQEGGKASVELFPQNFVLNNWKLAELCFQFWYESHTKTSRQAIEF